MATRQINKPAKLDYRQRKLARLLSDIAYGRPDDISNSVKDAIQRVGEARPDLDSRQWKFTLIEGAYAELCGFSSTPLQREVAEIALRDYGII